MSRKIKGLVFACLALILTLSLVSLACAPKAPVGEVVPKADLTKAQADLAAEKQKTAAAETKTKDVEAELAAAQKPAKVYNWQPASWANAGSVWDQMVYMGKWLDVMSDGRIKITPSAVGAVCPVEEQIEAVSAGTTGMMCATSSYYAGKIPGSDIVCLPPLAKNVDECIDMFEYFEDGALLKFYNGEVEKLYNVKVPGAYYYPQDCIISASVPIRSLADLKGKKFRCGDETLAHPLTVFGASTVWFPGSEIYTSLATGVVDAFTYGSSYDHYANSFHEVTKYWVRNPVLCGPYIGYVQVNRDVWNELSDDLKQMIITAIDASSMRVNTETAINIAKSWTAVAAAGVELIDWPAADEATWNKTRYEEMLKVAAAEPIAAEIMSIIERWGKAKGYL
jgi:TRAP-type C4-dicarboxylate transport system substrate-binding protein